MNEYTLKIVGDPFTGKTSFVITLINGKFPFNEYIPTTTDNWWRDIEMEKNRTVLIMAMEDTAHGEDYWKLRPLSYPGADVFIVFYRVDCRQSLESVKDRWIPELRDFCPNTPIVIVANKIDRRNDSCATVSYSEGLEMAKQMGTSYFEVSCVENRGLVECAKLAIEIADLNRRQFRANSKSSSAILPPMRPIPDPPPVMEAATSTFSDDLQQMLSHPKFHDVKFLLQGGLSILAHRLVLCSASPFFKKIFTTENFNKGEWCASKVQEIQQVYDSGDGKEITVEMSNNIKPETFSNLLKLLYTRSPCDDTDDVNISDLEQVIDVLESSQLDEECKDVITRLGQKKGCNVSDFLKMNTSSYLKQDMFSDVAFSVDGTFIPGHKAVIFARCPKLTDLIEAICTTEGSSQVIPISETSVENFSILLEYIYTDSITVDKSSDLVGIIALANKYEAHQLVAICEVEPKLVNTINLKNAIEMLQKFKSEECKAPQLVDWCRYFISLNYSQLSDDEEFSTLHVDDRNYIEEHRWPSLDYELERQAFYSHLPEIIPDTAKVKSKRKCAIL